MTWLQGGPFLEVSFLLPLEQERQHFVNNVLTKLKTFTPTVEFAVNEVELKEKINEFDTGFYDDEKNPNSKIYRSIQIPIYIDTGGKRKSVLSFRQLSDNLVAIDFWFFGSVWDEPEWNQKGIAENQISIFHSLLDNLFDAFDFIIGTVGYENSVSELFDTNETYPNEKYILDNLSKQSLQTDNYYSYIVANKIFIDLHDIYGIKTNGQKQTLD